MNRVSQYFILVFLLMLGGAAIMTVSIDPYVMFRFPRVENYNKYKPVAIKFIRVVKPYHTSLLEYETIITGTSRTAQGLHCRYFYDKGATCYNASLPMATMYETLVALQQRSSEYKTALVSLEFISFMVYPKGHPSFKEERYRRDSDGELNRHFINHFFNDTLGLMFSKQALLSSRATWRARNRKMMFHRQGGRRYFDNWGAWAQDQSTMDGISNKIQKDRQAKRFSHVLLELTKIYQEKTENPEKMRSNIEKQFSTYEEVLKLGYRLKIDMRFFIPTSHMVYWALQEHLGYAGILEEWKRSLVVKNQSLADLHGVQPFPIFDFSGVNRYSVTEIPRLNEPKTTNSYYYDAAHFYSEIGDLLLDKVTGECEPGNRDLFGACLQLQDLDNTLVRQRNAFELYVKANSQVLEELFEAAGQESTD